MNLFTIFYFFFVYTIELGSMLLINKYFYSFLDNNWDNFKNISPLHKKWYVVSNLTKSIIFSFYSYHIYFILSNYITYNQWNTNDFLYLGSIYSSIDMASIILVPKLSKNTLYHHLVVNVLYFYTLLNGMDEYTFSKLIVIYALFSVLAFPVNFYLSCRVLWKDNVNLEYLSSFCFVNYIVCCIPNWSFQFYNLYFNEIYLSNYSFLSRLLFSFIIMIIIYDDIVLMKYLKDHSLFKNIINLKLITN